MLNLNPSLQAKIGFVWEFDCIDSTNQFLLDQKASLEAEAAQGHFKGYALCLADQQTAGRGRLGRLWQSPPGLNIYLSISYFLKSEQSRLEATQIPDLSLEIGEKIINVLEGLGVQGLSLKWPNDVYLNQKKLAGILIETRRNYVVLGIGLNVGKNNLEIDQPWTDLSEYPNLSRETIIQNLLEVLL
ncbi:MAG: biotin--[acetyl-CoA-carboxylase] ligase [Gammaproteobacteria bacterium]